MHGNWSEYNSGFFWDIFVDMPIKNDSDIYNLNDIKPSQLSMHKYKVNALNMLYKIITMTTHSVLSDRESELS